jgi:hypothetical protein
MPRKEKQTHALLVRWGRFELRALGLPAIIAVVVLTVVGARWFGLF